MATAQAAAAPQPATQPGVSWQGTAGGVICFLVSVFAQKKMHAVHARHGFAPQSRRAHGEGRSASEGQPLPTSILDSNLSPIPTFQRFPWEGDEVAVNYGPPGDPEFWAAKVDKITLRSGKDAPPKQGTPPHSRIRVKFSDKTVTLGGSVFAGDQHGQGWLLLHAPPPSSASSAASHFLNEGVTKLAPKNVRFIHARGPQCTPARCIRPHGTQADGTTCVSPAAFPKFGWQPGSNRSSRESSPELDLQSPIETEPSLLGCSHFYLIKMDS